MIDVSFNGFTGDFGLLGNILARVESIVAEGNEFTDFSKCKNKITRLDLSRQQLSYSAIKPFRMCFENLEYLKLEECQIANSSFQLIV